jgi:AcrR family transcriptional regulator
MTRHKTRSDESVLDSALAVALDKGVHRLTFAALAEHCGLSAATLVQRFANKANLTQRTLLHAWDNLDAQTRELASTVPKTPDGAVRLLVGLSPRHGEIDAYGQGLLMLREDLRDPVLRKRGVAWEAALTAALTECFASVPDAPSGIGFALAAHWQGALTWWAFGAERPLDEYLTGSLNSVVEMLLPTRRRSPRDVDIS